MKRRKIKSIANTFPEEEKQVETKNDENKKEEIPAIEEEIVLSNNNIETSVEKGKLQSEDALFATHPKYDLFLTKKSIWQEVQKELMKQIDSRENIRLRNHKIQMKWLKFFGNGELKIMGLKNQIEECETIIRIKEAEPSLDIDHIKNLIAEKKKETEADLQLLKDQVN